MTTQGKLPEPAGVRVSCWGEADAALAELGRLGLRMAAIKERGAAAIARAEASAVAALERLAARQRRLERALERFCRRQGPELERVNGHGRRSRRLQFGRVGYRASRRVVVRSEATALRALAHWRTGQQFLRLRTELDREGLRQFLLQEPNGTLRVERRLRQAGIRLERRESWFYELDPRAGEWGAE